MNIFHPKKSEMLSIFFDVFHTKNDYKFSIQQN